MKFSYSSFFVDKNLIKKSSEQLLSHIDQLNSITLRNSYEVAESSINLPLDESILREAETLKAKKVSSKLKYVINIGIGGSNLGAKAVYDAIHGYFDIIETYRFPKMIFADTNDPEYLGKLSNMLKNEIKNPEEILVCLISKSGTTTETIANFEIINQILQKNFQDIRDRLVAITDEGSKLWIEAKNKGIATLSIPKTTGGRYSVFSNVGIFPLLCIGLNVKALILGAKEMRDICITKTIEKNPAILSAFLLYQHFKKGNTINDNFFFHPELESLGKWYRQLMGESIGKEKDVDGNTVNQGITPTVSIGSTDLHSMGQLYLGGPKDKTTTFVYAKSAEDIKIPDTLFFQDMVGDISGKSAGFVVEAIMNGVKIAYEKKRLPFMEVLLDDISEKSLGEFLQFKMIEMMYLGKLMNVNAFDQPNVEDYKVETKKLLSGKENLSL